MVYLLQKPYKNGHIYMTKFEYRDIDAALDQLAKHGPKSDVLLAHQYWIEDKTGKVLMTPRKTKKEAAEKWHQKDRLRFSQWLNA
jgi:hypothetical protein